MYIISNSICFFSKNLCIPEEAGVRPAGCDQLQQYHPCHVHCTAMATCHKSLTKLPWCQLGARCCKLHEARFLNPDETCNMWIFKAQLLGAWICRSSSRFKEINCRTGYGILSLPIIGDPFSDIKATVFLGGETLPNHPRIVRPPNWPKGPKSFWCFFVSRLTYLNFQQIFLEQLTQQWTDFKNRDQWDHPPLESTFLQSVFHLGERCHSVPNIQAIELLSWGAYSLRLDSRYCRPNFRSFPNISDINLLESSVCWPFKCEHKIFIWRGQHEDWMSFLVRAKATQLDLQRPQGL